MNISNKNTATYIIITVLVLVIFWVAIGSLQEQDDSLGGRIERAAEDLSDGARDAARELDPDRGPVEKIGEAIGDAGEDIKDATEK